MSAETLKTSLINLASFCDYLNENTEWAVNHADILALIAQERAEAIAGRYVPETYGVCQVSAEQIHADQQKLRLDEFTRAILAGMLANERYDLRLDADRAALAKLQALAQMAENDRP